MKNKCLSTLSIVLLSQLLMIGSAAAARSYVDFTDIWYDPDTSGWGINIVQSGNSFDYMFATLFIYDPTTGEPTWVTAELKHDGSKNDVFTGKLYRHVSLPTNTPFSPNQLESTEVGTLTFTASAPNKAEISYVVGGTTVQREIVRQSLTGNSINGTYYGGVLVSYDTCQAPVFNAMRVTVKKDGNTTTFILTTLPNENVVCNLKGILEASGRVAAIDNAKYICQNMTTGNTVWDIKADVSNIVVTTQGIEGEWITTKKISDIGCKETGRFSAVLY
jgi:hypothetical protein